MNLIMGFCNLYNSDDSNISITISANKVNFVLLGFNFTCIAFGLLAALRDIIYVENGYFLGDPIGVWNGFSNMTCFVGF